MNWRRLLIVFAIGCAMFSVSRSASAQRTRPYQSSRPTTSPYLNLYRSDSAVVDNYNAFVRPEMEMRSVIERQQNALSRQGTEIGAIQQRMLRPQRSAARSTSAGVFMNYLHYYSWPRTGTRSAIRGR